MTNAASRNLVGTYCSSRPHSMLPKPYSFVNPHFDQAPFLPTARRSRRLNNRG